MRTNLHLIEILAVFILYGCTSGAQKKQLFENPDAPIEARVDNLLSLMTLEEKVSQMMHESPAIERLGIPEYNWWNECLHGVGRAGQATVFPQAIGMAATFDEALMYRIATAISDEARAKHHDYKKKGLRDYYQGLTFWTPNINIFRDPRWGRGMETYGEDPYLTGTMGVQFVKGLQGHDSTYFKLIATPKHYVVHSGPEYNRHSFNAVSSMRDFYQTYLPAFERTVKEANAQSVMCAYNRTNGDVCCGSDELLRNILRYEVGFNGYIVSDCGAIQDFYYPERHHVAQTAPEAAAKAVLAGTDLNCGETYQALVEAVQKNLLSEDDIDVALGRLLKAKIQLGMFDPDERVPYSTIPLQVVESNEHIELSLETARKSMVLLKNKNALLPLSKDIKKIAVIGPNADDVEPLYANYNGFSKKPVTPLEGIESKLPSAEVLYAQGCCLAPNLPSLVPILSEYLFTDNTFSQQGLKGDYFANDTLGGKPLLTRIDPNIDYNWWNDAPLQELNPTNFGVRWTGYLKSPVSGDYFIGYQSAYLSMWIDDELIGSSHNVHHPTKVYKKMYLEAGKTYKLRLELKKHRGMALEKLMWQIPDSNMQQKAIDIARKSDVIVLCMGLSPLLEGEEMKVEVEGFKGGDRISLNIPKVQTELMKELKKLGKPMVLVLMNGSAISVNWEKENMDAILEAWYPGQEGGNAIADILFGDYNPAGRLPITFYKSEKDLPDFEDYRMQGRTYRYFGKEPLWEFGSGLSYTQFEYIDLYVENLLSQDGIVKVSAQVRNTGKYAGEEVVEVYVKDLGGKSYQPIHSLAGFKRIFLNPGEIKNVHFELDKSAFEQINDDLKRLIEPGKYKIIVGGSQPVNTTGSKKHTHLTSVIIMK